MTIDFIFDLDGTLTDAREYIDPQFKEFMHEFTEKYSCSICTGSDYAKVESQLGKNLTERFDTLFLSSGNHVVQDGKDVYKSKWSLSQEEYWFLMEQVKASDYFNKVSDSVNSIETRIGCANFSVIGVGEFQLDRSTYSTWDKQHKERQQIAQAFNDLFGHKSSAVIGGSVSIDITQQGKDKAQIIQYFEAQDTIHFFGDKIIPGGNDYTLAMAVNKLENGNSYTVKNWQQTYEILKTQF